MAKRHYSDRDLAALAAEIAARLPDQQQTAPAGFMSLDDVAPLFADCDRDTARGIMREAGIAAVKVPGFRRTVYPRAAVAAYVARLEAGSEGRRPALRRAS